MNLSGKRMTICIIEPTQSGTHDASKYSLDMVTTKPRRIKVALKELEDAEMRRYGVLSPLQSLEDYSLVRWRELHFCNKWISVPRSQSGY